MTQSAPGPSKARSILGLARDPFGFLTQCVERYGDHYRLPLGKGILVVNDPEHIGVWLSDYEHFVKGEMSRAIEPALGMGIPISDGERWRRNRKAMNPMFGRRNLDGLTAIVNASLDASMQRWDRLAERRDTVDIAREVSIMTMQILQRALFSSSVPDDDVPQLVDAFDRLRRWMGGLMLTYWTPGFVPTPGERLGRQGRACIVARIKSAIEDRRRTPTDTPDLLNLLLETTYEDGSSMSDAELEDELMGLWFGGYDTTGSALSWTLALLSQHPEAVERLQAEAEQYTGDFVGFADLAKMAWAKACFDEGQRIQGGLLLTRDAVCDTSVGGYDVPKGTMVALSSYTLNRHQRFWSDPQTYDPSRFLGPTAAEMHKYQFVMFGGGPRHCIGFGLTYLEAQFALTKIGQRFEVQTTPGFAPRHEFHLSVGIKGGVPATIRRRAA